MGAAPIMEQREIVLPCYAIEPRLAPNRASCVDQDSSNRVMTPARPHSATTAFIVEAGAAAGGGGCHHVARRLPRSRVAFRNGHLNPGARAGAASGRFRAGRLRFRGAGAGASAASGEEDQATASVTCALFMTFTSPRRARGRPVTHRRGQFMHRRSGGGDGWRLRHRAGYGLHRGNVRRERRDHGGTGSGRGPSA